MPKPYTIDLNADRCIYSEPGRTYVATLEDWHSYNGPAAIITVTEKNVSYDDTMGTIRTFPQEDVVSILAIGINGHVNVAITSFSFEAKIPDLGEEIRYSWPPLGVSKEWLPQ